MLLNVNHPNTTSYYALLLLQQSAVVVEEAAKIWLLYHLTVVTRETNHSVSCTVCFF